MSAITSTAQATRQAPAVSLGWIIGARDDLVWFIGSAAASYALFALYAWGVPLPFWALLAWAVLVDVPHVFATLSRTYLDREERRARRRLLAGSLLLFLVGPAMFLAGAGPAFILLVGLWTCLHQAKQHYGFAVLYQRKNSDTARADNLLDLWFMRVGFGSPLADFLLRRHGADGRLPEALSGLLAAARVALLALTLALACAWLVRQARRAWAGPALNVPKCLLLAVAVPLYWLVLLSPAGPADVAGAAALLAPFHVLQYHRLVWFHNRKYAGGERARERHGAAALLGGRLLFYAVFVVGVSAAYHALRYGVGTLLGRGNLWTEALLAFLLGHLLVHFYLDSRIWRVRRDPSLAGALTLDERSPATAARGAALCP